MRLSRSSERRRGASGGRRGQRADGGRGPSRCGDRFPSYHLDSCTRIISDTWFDISCTNCLHSEDPREGQRSRVGPRPERRRALHSGYHWSCLQLSVGVFGRMRFFPRVHSPSCGFLSKSPEQFQTTWSSSLCTVGTSSAFLQTADNICLLTCTVTRRTLPTLQISPSPPAQTLSLHLRLPVVDAS